MGRKVIDRQIPAGYYVTVKRTAVNGRGEHVGCLGGIEVFKHENGFIMGRASWDGSTVCMADTSHAIISHNVPDFDHFDILSAKFKANEISWAEFVDAFQRGR